MFYASDLINRVLVSTVSITIIDGQNEEVIGNYSDDFEFNPCILEPIPLDKHITITFEAGISSFEDWFPDICRGGNYSNEYMFDGAQDWHIYNLIVENYTVSDADSYYLVRSDSQYADIELHDCHYIDIVNEGKDYAIFDTYGSLHFYDSEFLGITTNLVPMIEATHSVVDTGIQREFTMEDCVFTDIVSSDALFYLDYSWNDVKWNAP